ncbi:MAG TPA: hypothetical protein VL986_10385 [Terracidiphilus sp.]|nr:hypothetical protein [Terracidiphilus sp.]
MKVLGLLGMDRAVAFTFLARLVSIAGSVGTVLLIVRFLSPVEQGYYYTLLSLVSLQMVFELGFSFVIQQLTAHECARLEFGAEGGIAGDKEARARLASVLKLSVRWYSLAAAVMALALAPMGMIFFARSGATGETSVAWQGPWLCAVVASSVGLWCLPFYSFLEGCGYVREAAAMRLRQAAVGALSAWMLMAMHHGLYSPAVVLMSQAATGVHFIAGHRRLFKTVLHCRTESFEVDWKNEVWPFQWRIAVSWMCSYFTAQVLIPILFTLRGPVEAGQMGMSLSITGYMSALVLPWISTKATPFGRMVASGQFHSLDKLFRETFGRAMAVFGVIALGACIGVALLPMISARLAARIVSPRLFAVLVIAAGANCAVQCLAILLRSFKKEPFLVQSLIAAGLAVGLAVLVTPRWGSAGAVSSQLAAFAAFALPSALYIFARSRREYLDDGVQVGLKGSAA